VPRTGAAEPVAAAGHPTADAPPGGLAVRALGPVAVPPAAERIAGRFVTAIALGQFVPGQHLPSVRDLAVLLGVSTNTVRDAIGRLAALGHVTVTRGRTGGTVVTGFWGPESDAAVRRVLEPQWPALELLLDFRSLVEQQIARTAAERRTPDDIAAITRALGDYESAGSDREASRAADLALHLAIARAAHNPHLTELSLRVRRDVTLGFTAEPYSAAVRERALVQHPGLARAVVDADPARAAVLAGEHFSLTEATWRALHARVGALPAGTHPRPP